MFDSKTDVLGIVLGLVVSVLFIVWYYRSMLRFKMPPGPWGLPGVGYLPFLGVQPHETFLRLAGKFGDVYNVQIGSFKCIVVNGRATIKDMLLNSVGVFDSRPGFYSYNVRNGRFALGNYSDKWLVLKKTVVEQIAVMMNDKNHSIETLLKEEAKQMLSEITKHNGKSFDPQNELYDIIGSILYQILFGKRNDVRSDRDFRQLISLERGFAEHAHFGNPAEVMPKLSKLCCSLVKPIHDLADYYIHDRNKRELDNRRPFIKTSIEDLTGRFLELKDDETSKMKAAGVTVDDLLISLEEIFSAGFDVTVTAMRWIVLILVRFPTVQRQLYDEIEREIGNREPSLTDKMKMPFTEAVILETLRYKCPMPLAAPHCTIMNARIGTYVVPKSTPVIFNLHSLARDSKLWEYPDGFYPEHFLSVDGQVDREKAELVSPFGLGTRKCVGELIAKNSIFLSLVNLVQKFEIMPVDNEEYSMTGVLRMTDRPKPYKIIAQERSSC